MSLRALALLLLVLPTAVSAAEIRVETVIDEVTVHPSSALVSRLGNVQLPAGSVRLYLEGLTPQLQDDTLRLHAGGGARARLLGVAVEMQPQADSTSPEVRAAEEEVRELELRDRALVDDRATAEEQLEFLDALRATYAKERSENLPVRQVNTAEWTKMVGFLGTQYEQVRGAIRESERKRAALQRELDAARRRLSQIQSKGTRSWKRAVVDLQVERPGSIELRLEYLVHGASWQPRWDARLLPASKRIDLGLQAWVQQRTGEDWENVRLVVSSAEPQTRTTIPELQPLYLSKAPPPSPRYYDSAAKRAVPQVSAGAARESVAEDEMAFVPAPAQVSVQLLSASYTAPNRATIPSTGEGRKSFLASNPVEAALRRVAAPAVDERAWLTAKGRNETGAPLLAGPVELFVEGAFVGRTNIGDVPEGGELELSFGADPRIKVERTVLDRNREDTGLFSKRERLTYKVRTTLKSLYREAVEVEILDRLPVSRDEDIEVKILEATAGAVEDAAKPGVRTWKLSLDPRKEQKIEVGYEVTYPAGARIVGLP